MIDFKELHTQYITNESGERVSIVLPIEEFLELMEDIEDIAAIAERRDESTIEHEDVVNELKQDGLI